MDVSSSSEVKNYKQHDWLKRTPWSGTQYFQHEAIQSWSQLLLHLQFKAHDRQPLKTYVGVRAGEKEEKHILYTYKVVVK